MDRRSFLSLPFIAPIVALVAKAKPAPQPSHFCWKCWSPVYFPEGYTENWRGEIRYLEDGLAGDHVLCPDCGIHVLRDQWGFDHVPYKPALWKDFHFPKKLSSTLALNKQ